MLVLVCMCWMYVWQNSKISNSFFSNEMVYDGVMNNKKKSKKWKKMSKKLWLLLLLFLLAFFVGRRCKSFLAAVRLKCIYTHRLYKVSMFWCWARSFRIGRNIFVDVLVCMRVYALSFREKKFILSSSCKTTLYLPEMNFFSRQKKTGFMITNGPICFL